MKQSHRAKRPEVPTTSMATPRRSLIVEGLRACSSPVIILLGLALISCVAEGSSRDRQVLGLDVGVQVGHAESGHKVFDVTSFGVTEHDEDSENAVKFIQAWNAACKSGGPAKLVVPPGTFTTGPVVFQGPCNCSNPMIVEFKGTLKPTTDMSEFSSSEWILFEIIDGLLVKGGVFDGQGPAVWKYNDCKGNQQCAHLPASIHFNRVTNATIEDVTSINSMGFHISMTFSSHIKAHKLNLTAPGDSPNTDGIHISTTDFVHISNSTIATGDDCLGIIQGARNISVSNIQCGPGHGISIGSLGKYPDEKDVMGVHVWNCTLSNTTNGVRIKTMPGERKLVASDIIFEDIVMNGVKNPVLIDQNYGSKKASKPSSVKISNVHFKRIRGTTVSVNPVSLTCSSLVPCEGIELIDIDLAYNGTKPLPSSSFCSNAKAVFSGKQNPPACGAGAGAGASASAKS